MLKAFARISYFLGVWRFVYSWMNGVCIECCEILELCVSDLQVERESNNVNDLTTEPTDVTNLLISSLW